MKFGVKQRAKQARKQELHKYSLVKGGVNANDISFNHQDKVKVVNFGDFHISYRSTTVKNSD